MSYIIDTEKAQQQADWEADQVYRDIKAERERQFTKWGQQNHEPMVWGAILGEEVGELAQAMLADTFGSKDHSSHSASMREEAVQIAAVAVAFIQHLDRKTTS